MLLAQLTAGDDGSFGNNPDRQRAVLAAMIAVAPWLNFAQFYPIEGPADEVAKVNHVTGAGENRALGSGYATTTDSGYTPVSAALRIVGDRLRTDQALERRGRAGESVVKSDMVSVGQSVGRHLTDQFINGDGTGQNLKGLKSWITPERTITAGTNGLQLTYGNSDTAVKSQQQLVTYLKRTVGRVGGAGPNTILMMDEEILLRYQSIAAQAFSTAKVIDYFGIEHTVNTFGNVPIIVSGVAKDNSTLVLPYNETVGSSNDCTSVYAIRFGERADVSLIGNKGVSVKDNGFENQAYVTSVEVDTNVIVIDDWALAKLSGLRVA